MDHEPGTLLIIAHGAGTRLARVMRPSKSGWANAGAYLRVETWSAVHRGWTTTRRLAPQEILRPAIVADYSRYGYGPRT